MVYYLSIAYANNANNMLLALKKAILVHEEVKK